MRTLALAIAMEVGTPNGVQTHPLLRLLPPRRTKSVSRKMEVSQERAVVMLVMMIAIAVDVTPRLGA